MAPVESPSPPGGRRPGFDKTRHPRIQDGRDIDRVGAPGEKAIGIIQRDEALGMSGGSEDRACIRDAHGLIARCMTHDERGLEPCDAILKTLLPDVLQELLSDRELPPGKCHFGFSRGLDFIDPGAEIMNHVTRIRRRTDRRDGAHLRDISGNRQNGGATEAVPDQDLRHFVILPQEIGGSQKIFDIGREIGVGEFVFACP